MGNQVPTIGTKLDRKEFFLDMNAMIHKRKERVNFGDVLD